MLKNDSWIIEQANLGMITPFEQNLVRQVAVDELDDLGQLTPKLRSVLSYGTSSYGYDMRLSRKEFSIFKHKPGTVINPKRFNTENLEPAPLQSDIDGDFFVLPHNSYGLGVALERLLIPPNITCIFIGKSTYARCGIIWNLTPGEAGWRGWLTLEASNASPADCRVYADEGVVQALFLEGEPCRTTYEARQGKYQDQPQSIVTAKV